MTLIFRSSLIALAGACALATPLPAGAADAAIAKISDDLQIRQLAPGVWMHTSWNTLPTGMRYPSNGLLVREDQGCLLIDTAWGEAPTRSLLDWIDRELHLRVVRAIVTHAHDDRMGGAAVLVERHIPFSSHPLTRVLAAKKHWPAPETIPGIEAAGSAVTSGTVEIFYPGPAHTPDNIMVWIPQAKILFAGCAVKDAPARNLGNVEDADLANWPRAIRRTQQRYPEAKVVVPGHGEPGAAELLQHTLDLCRP